MSRRVENGLKMIYFELKIVKMSQLIEKKHQGGWGGGGNLCETLCFYIAHEKRLKHNTL